jgi:hypothetical protein
MKESKESLLTCIFKALEKGNLKQPFDGDDIKKICPGFAEPTYKSTLVHHRKGNPINQPEYFERLDSGKYSLIKKK